MEDDGRPSQRRQARGRPRRSSRQTCREEGGTVGLNAQYSQSTEPVVDARPTGCCQISTTLPPRAAADKLAEALVTERLAACTQVLGPLSSTYRWKGVVEHAEE